MWQKANKGFSKLHEVIPRWNFIFFVLRGYFASRLFLLCALASQTFDAATWSFSQHFFLVFERVVIGAVELVSNELIGIKVCVEIGFRRLGSSMIMVEVVIRFNLCILQIWKHCLFRAILTGSCNRFLLLITRTNKFLFCIRRSTSLFFWFENFNFILFRILNIFWNDIIFTLIDVLTNREIRNSRIFEFEIIVDIIDLI